MVRTGGRARKSPAGYDLTRLLVGAEGTLGVVTEVRLRLYGIPEAISAATCSFETFEGAVEATIETIQCGIPVARIEFLDAVMVDAVQPLLGPRPPGAADALPRVPRLARGRRRAGAMRSARSRHAHGRTRWDQATDLAERNRLWKARHDAYYAGLALRPGCRGLPTDVCVPVSRLADCITETRADLVDAGVARSHRGPRR